MPSPNFRWSTRWPSLMPLASKIAPPHSDQSGHTRFPQVKVGHGIDSPSNPPRVRGNVRDAIRDDGVAAAGTGMCRLRRPVRCWLWPEGTGEASGLAGVAFLLVTFLWPRKEKSLAQARRAGETLSRAQPSRPARRQPCQEPKPFTNPSSPTLLPQGEKGARRSREQTPLPLGEGQGEGIRALPTLHTPSPATWRRRRRTGSAPGSAGRPLRS
ncbi:hypothetical protein D3C78_629850 [compost metagenome]